MKRTLLTLTAIALTLSVMAQTVKPAKKVDSLTFSKTSIELIQRNSDLIQNAIHQMHLDAIFRDKLDSVYSQSRFFTDEKLNPQNYKRLK